jgi:hypothetical protein
LIAIFALNRINIQCKSTQCQLIVIVVIVIPTQAFSLVATYTVTHFFLLTVALVFADYPFILTTVSSVLPLIGTTAFLPAVLAVIGIGHCYGRRK